MKPVDKIISYLESNLEKFNLEWISKGRSGDNWKSRLFEHNVTKRQIGIYDRKTMILVRLEIENYVINIDGVTVRPKIPKGDSWEASFSNFKGGKGVCLQVDTLENFKILLNWYYDL